MYTSTCDTSECNSLQQPWAGHRLSGVLRRHGEHYSCDAFSIIQSNSLRLVGQFAAEKSTFQLYEPDSLFRVCVSRQTMFWVFDVSLVCIPFWYWPTYVNWSFKCINAWHMLRLAIIYLLRAKPNDFACHIALKCASFSKMNIGTSCRSPCTPYGYEDYASVKLANMLMERQGWCHFASINEGMLAIVSINFDCGF